jgi:hypothetical protein
MLWLSSWIGFPAMTLGLYGPASAVPRAHGPNWRLAGDPIRWAPRGANGRPAGLVAGVPAHQALRCSARPSQEAIASPREVTPSFA